jgi:hypothetical protein
LDRSDRDGLPTQYVPKLAHGLVVDSDGRKQSVTLLDSPNKPLCRTPAGNKKDRIGCVILPKRVKGFEPSTYSLGKYPKQAQKSAFPSMIFGLLTC